MELNNSYCSSQKHPQYVQSTSTNAKNSSSSFYPLSSSSGNNSNDFKRTKSNQFTHSPQPSSNASRSEYQFPQVSRYYMPENDHNRDKSRLAQDSLFASSSSPTSPRSTNNAGSKPQWKNPIVNEGGRLYEQPELRGEGYRNDKKPPNAWILYRSERFKSLNKASNVNQGDFSKLVATLWESEPQHVKDSYRKMAELEKFKRGKEQDFDNSLRDDMV